MAKARYSEPTSTTDLKARQKDDYVPASVKVVGEDSELSDNGYVGVSAEYQNYANLTEAPIKAEKGPEAKVFENFVDEDADYKSAAAPEGERDADDDEEEEAGTPAASRPTPPSGGPTSSNS